MAALASLPVDCRGIIFACLGFMGLHAPRAVSWQFAGAFGRDAIRKVRRLPIPDNVYSLWLAAPLTDTKLLWEIFGPAWRAKPYMASTLRLRGAYYHMGPERRPMWLSAGDAFHISIQFGK